MVHLLHKFITAVVLCATTVFFTQAQGIHFESTTFEEAVTKASKENKLLFIDCFTSWCGPCKVLSRDIFPNDTVGLFFNPRFVSLKIDMEKGEGKTIAENYTVKAFPTLLFIDPHSREIVNRIVGVYSGIQWLIEGARQATDPSRNLKGLSIRYTQNKQDIDAAQDYLSALRSASMKAEADSILNDYLANLSEEERYSEKNWQLLVRQVDNIYSPTFNYLSTHAQAFRLSIGEEAVNSKLETLYRYAILKFIYRKRIPVEEFPQKNFDKLCALMKDYNGKNAAYFQAQLNLISHVQQGDYDGMLQALTQAEKQGVLTPDVHFFFIWLNLTYLRECKENKVINKGLKWLEKLKPNAEDINTTRAWLRMKASLYAAKGDTDMQNKLNKEADRLQ